MNAYRILGSAGNHAKADNTAIFCCTKAHKHTLDAANAGKLLGKLGRGKSLALVNKPDLAQVYGCRCPFPACLAHILCKLLLPQHRSLKSRLGRLAARPGPQDQPWPSGKDGIEQRMPAKADNHVWLQLACKRRFVPDAPASSDISVGVYYADSSPRSELCQSRQQA